LPPKEEFEEVVKQNVQALRSGKMRMPSLRRFSKRR
jgi:hypothetical protein